MITNRKEIKLYKAKSILDVTEKDSLYCLKADNETEFKIIVTDAFGNPVNLKDLTGGAVTNVINTDGSITITGSGVKDIKLSATLYNLINSALQAGDNISSLTNDSNFITLGDIPAFNSADYDLTDFTNSDVDPFARLSDIVSGSGVQSIVAGTNITVDNTDPLNPVINSTASGATNLGYSASPIDGTVTSDSGSDATIPLADSTNAGLLSPSEKSDIASAIQPSDLATVATSGDYTDLINIPTEFNPSAHTHPISDIINLQTELDSKVDENVAIAGATKSKITYDSKGLVTSGADATTDDITEGTNLYFTTVRVLATLLAGLSASSGTFTSSDTILTAFGKIKFLIDNIASTYQAILTEVNFGTFSSGLTSKTTPVDADTMNISDSADLNKAKKVSLTNLYDNYIKPKIDSVFATIASPTFTGTVTTPTIIVSSETASRIAIIDTSKNIKSADTTTYPNLTELSYIKGLTSSAQSQITANAVNVITITTSISIDTDTTSGGYGQHGRHTKISNGANAINLTVQTSSNADFVASYEKIGSSTITFVAGSGATLTTLSGTASMTGIAGSKACLSRNGNTYYLQITNY